ncbi:ABC transporter permease [Thiothrix subterranea]|uniref:ABC transporter permease n=1 Tax=Thiothrix subterranea TaxID=2735563 RepID=UPI00280C3808|nr:ABC transporter permease subunit [Thiothrix subterranea]
MDVFAGVNEYTLQTQANAVGAEDMAGISEALIPFLFSTAASIMLVVTPLITMRLFAEERMNQTLILLTSSPVSNTQIVLGKYLSVLGFVLLFVVLVALMPLSLALATPLDWGQLAAASLGLLLLLAAFTAAGLFLSSLARQPVIAAVTTFGFLLLLDVLYQSGNAQGLASELFVYLSAFGHFLSFAGGMFNSSDLVYYGLFIAGFLILTIRKLDNDRLQG